MVAPHVVLHCHAGGVRGMGHLMRCVALAEEAVARGWAVTFTGELSEDASAQVAAMVPQAHVRPGPPLARGDVLHLDTYDAVEIPSAYQGLVSAMQDGSFGVRTADLAIDANLGAEASFAGDRARHALVGVSAVLVRRAARQRRPDADPVPPQAGRPRRVLVVMGGTDPFAMAPRVLAGLADLDVPLEITAVTPPALEGAVAEIAARCPHPVTVTPFVADLPALAATQDLVISAAGTSVWELACMGVPMALLCVVDNQVAGYRAVLEAGLAIGLGEPPHDDLPTRLKDLGPVLADQQVLARLGARGRQVVDGLGVWRIVSAWEQLLSVPAHAAPDAALRARPATSADARVLLEWRNDPGTRAGSRSSPEVAWDDHVRWLDGVLASPERRLLVVESDGEALGTVRWDHLGGVDWEVSITMAPAARGRGLAAPLLRAGEEALPSSGAVRLIATVHQDNAASRRLFERAGYLPWQPADQDGYAVSARWRSA